MNDMLKLDKLVNLINQTIGKENLVAKVHMSIAYYSQYTCPLHIIHSTHAHCILLRESCNKSTHAIAYYSQ